MQQLTFSELSQDNLPSIVNLVENDFDIDIWNKMILGQYSEKERDKLNFIQEYLANYQLNLMNEATIWARAIYPLLMLAERNNIQAWAEVPLKAKFPHFELTGIVDGVLGKCVAGEISIPYLVVVEAKRGLEAKNPRFQLYGEMLAAAWSNWRESSQIKQQIFGCYTISDNWTFVSAMVKNFEDDCPTMIIDTSKEYIQRIEAATIFQILKFIISKYVNRRNHCHDSLSHGGDFG